MNGRQTGERSGETREKIGKNGREWEKTGE
jgi:hypothetical protein